MHNRLNRILSMLNGQVWLNRETTVPPWLGFLGSVKGKPGKYAPATAMKRSRKVAGVKGRKASKRYYQEYRAAQRQWQQMEVA